MGHPEKQQRAVRGEGIHTPPSVEYLQQPGSSKVPYVVTGSLYWNGHETNTWNVLASIDVLPAVTFKKEEQVLTQ